MEKILRYDVLNITLVIFEGVVNRLYRSVEKIKSNFAVERDILWLK